MMRKSFHVVLAGLSACLFFASSCSSSRLYKGFEYKGTADAPPVSGLVTADTRPEDPAPSAPVHNMATEVQTDQFSAAESMISQMDDQPEKVKQSARIALEEARKLAENNTAPSAEAIAKAASHSLEASGQIQHLTNRQEKKMVKMASRMEKKMQMQGKEFDWKHNSGLEIFFMIMAAAGLTVGIVAHPIGWVVFLVFAGLWLYWKLVKED